MPESERAREVVERLLTADGQASARLAEAEAHARQRLAEAAVEAERLRDRALEHAHRDHVDSLERARSQAEAQAASRVEAETTRWQRLADAAGAHVEAAAARVAAWVCGADPEGGSG